jgi:hypothetical protein
MTDSHSPTPVENGIDPGADQTVTNGRYVYCLVDIKTGDPTGLSVTGIDDEPIFVIGSERVGVVVHECDTLYDTDDMEQVKQWLLTHQQVIDAAGEQFGTPLPMRFDTIIGGGNPNVKQWLQHHYDMIREELTAFAGTWEYRIHLLWDSSAFETRVKDENECLQELQQRQQQAGAGKSFLLQKQYDKHLRELKQKRRNTLLDSLNETVSPIVKELTDQTSQSGPHDQPSSSTEEHVTRLAVLADEADESTLGSRLDEIVEEDGVQIRFTGPWPPYTFAPNIG